MAFASFDSKSASAPMAEINMVPLIDVMLVLLVIFIVTAPLLTHAVKLDLPQARARRPTSSSPTRSSSRSTPPACCYWNGESVTREEAAQRFAAASRKQPQPEVHLRADQAVAYRDVAADAGRRLARRPHARSASSANPRRRAEPWTSPKRPQPPTRPASRTRAAGRAAAAHRQRAAAARRERTAHRPPRRALPPAPDRPREADPHQVAAAPFIDLRTSPPAPARAHPHTESAMRRPDLDKTSHHRPASTALLPLGALAAGFGFALGGAQAQTPAATAQRSHPGADQGDARRPRPRGKDAYRATETRIGKGKQELRDIPQSVTVVTEKLIDDRNLDTLKEALKNTAGISFLAAEGGEEDIRLRGFSLQATGDIFVDGMRDPAFYERDTFNLDRLEVLRGSASMLFGRGSTGGAVNQVSKVPRLIDEHEVDVTVGSHDYRARDGRLQPQDRRERGPAPERDGHQGRQQRRRQQHRQAGRGRRPTAGASASATSSRSACTTWTTTTASTTACRGSARRRRRRPPTPPAAARPDGLLRHGQRLQRGQRQLRPRFATPTASATAASSRPRCAAGDYDARPARRHGALRPPPRCSPAAWPSAWTTSAPAPCSPAARS